MKKLLLFAGSISLTLFFSACGNSEEVAEIQIEDSVAVDSLDRTELPHEYISIPAPDEMFSFMKEIRGMETSTVYLNNPKYYKNYADTKSQALNFGIYAADFLYCSIFNYGSEALKYFTSIKKLGDNLGISGSINERAAERIKMNIGKNDSLTEISNAIYFSAISELEQSDKASILALVIVGGWVESMYLVTTIVKSYDTKNPALGRIAEQKYTLDNLMGYLDKYKSDENIAAVTIQLNELKNVFAQLPEESITSTISSKGSKKVFGGGTKILMNEEQYKAISESIKKIHGSFTLTNNWN